MALDLYIVSHTHWDREWYQPFQAYRARLVRVLDEMLDVLEADNAFPVFHFDGQTIVLEDYLEIRPHNRERLYALLRAGRLVVGPMYVMPDEFLVNGESLVRNLQAGHADCARLGVAPLANGYVTDIFGHNSQFPQILRGFGIDSALLYRGIGDYPKDAFIWEGADGSTVTAYKMDANRSYSNFYFALRWPFEGGAPPTAQEVAQRAGELLEVMRPQLSAPCVLMMDGTDHSGIYPGMPALLDTLRKVLPDVRIHHGRLEDYVKAHRAQNPALETIRGALYTPGRKGVNNQVLKNVLSSMVFLKQQNDACETLLARWAEPADLAAGLAVPARPGWDGPLMDRKDFHRVAWRTLLRNHPHDSICGCSLREVHEDNVYRFRQVRQLAETSLTDSLAQIAKGIGTAAGPGKDGAFVLFNAGDLPYDGVVVAEVPLSETSQCNLRLYGPRGQLLPAWQILEITPAAHPVVVPHKLVCFETDRLCRLAFEAAIPAHGYAAFTYDDLALKGPDTETHSYSYAEYHPPLRSAGSLRVSANSFDTGAIVVRVCEDGSLEVRDKATGHVYRNQFVYEDAGDWGDGWVTRPPVQNARYATAGGSCAFCVLADGPLAAELCLSARLMIPQSANDLRRTGEAVPLDIETRLLLKKGSAQIEAAVTVQNRSGNHRLRVLFDTGLESAADFYTKTPYDMQRWPIQKADTSDYIEADSLVNPSQGVSWMSDGKASFSLYSQGLYEVEAADNAARTFILNLLRTTANESGWRMQGNLPLMGESVFRLCADYTPCQTPAQAALRGDDWRNGLRLCGAGLQDGPLPMEKALVAITAKGVQLTALANGENGPYARLLNLGEHTATGLLHLPVPIAAAHAANLLGQQVRPLSIEDGGVRFTLGPKELLTIELRYESGR